MKTCANNAHARQRYAVVKIQKFLNKAFTHKKGTMTNLSEFARVQVIDSAVGLFVGTLIEKVFSNLPTGEDPADQIQGGVAAVAQIMANVFLWNEYSKSTIGLQVVNSDPKGMGSGYAFFTCSTVSQPSLVVRVFHLQKNIMRAITGLESDIPGFTSSSFGGAQRTTSGGTAKESKKANPADVPVFMGAPHPSAGPDNQTFTTSAMPVGADRRFGAPVFA